MNKTKIKVGIIPQFILILNIIISFIYFSWWFNPLHIGNVYLYGVLLFGEIYHVLMALLFWWTLWPHKTDKTKTSSLLSPSVDIFIPTAGESVDILKQTISAARDQNYQNSAVYVLNDGLVAKKDNWREVEKLCSDLGVFCITRSIGGGAKAGNINNALLKTEGEIIVIFDADMVADKNFLKKTLPFFEDESIGFVQTPQYYKNYTDNEITQNSWTQQEFFFGPVMVNKARTNSAFICGTNVAIRRKALEQVGGMREDNIAEDFLTSVNIHQKGWRSIYLNEVLAQGLAPVDLGSYYKQQYRWARGSLEVLFWENPLFKSGLTFFQKVHYLMSALFYFNGVIVLLDILVPLVFLAFGIQPVYASTTSFAIYFIPFIFLNLYTLYALSMGNLTFGAIALTQSLFLLQVQAVLSTIFRLKVTFSVTPKKGLTGNFVPLAFPHLAYIYLAVLCSVLAVMREGFSPSVMANLAWVIFNIVLFLPFIQSAFKVTRVMTTPIQRLKLARELHS